MKKQYNTNKNNLLLIIAIILILLSMITLIVLLKNPEKTSVDYARKIENDLLKNKILKIEDNILKYKGKVLNPYCFVDAYSQVYNNRWNDKPNPEEVILTKEHIESESPYYCLSDDVNKDYIINDMSSIEKYGLFEELKGHKWYYDNEREIGYSYSEDENILMVFSISFVPGGSYGPSSQSAELFKYNIKEDGENIKLKFLTYKEVIPYPPEPEEEKGFTNDGIRLKFDGQNINPISLYFLASDLKKDKEEYDKKYKKIDKDLLIDVQEFEFESKFQSNLLVKYGKVIFTGIDFSKDKGEEAEISKIDKGIFPELDSKDFIKYKDKDSYSGYRYEGDNKFLYVVSINNKEDEISTYVKYFVEKIKNNLVLKALYMKSVKKLNDKDYEIIIDKTF